MGYPGRGPRPAAVSRKTAGECSGRIEWFARTDKVRDPRRLGFSVAVQAVRESSGPKRGVAVGRSVRAEDLAAGTSSRWSRINSTGDSWSYCSSYARSSPLFLWTGWLLLQVAVGCTFNLTPSSLDWIETLSKTASLYIEMSSFTMAVSQRCSGTHMYLELSSRKV